VVEHVRDLAAAARRYLAEPELDSDKRRKLASTLLYNPGRGAEAAATSILHLLGI